MLDWTPQRENTQSVIPRTQDPFDKNVQFNSLGQALSTPKNPNALTFDPTYVYAPMQGIRFFLEIRFIIK